MSVQTSVVCRPDSAVKSSGVYLMELRRHVAEVNSRHHKLAVTSWSIPESLPVPILTRTQRLGRS